MSADLRRHPRFVSEQKVVIELLDRAELREVWTADISQGGMYIRTDEPPPYGTMLQVHVSTPDGSLDLNARVVHVVDEAASKAFDQPQGVGVQFVDLTPKMRDQIQSYVNGLATRLADELRVDAETQPLEVLLEQARAITTAIDEADPYRALGLSPGASLEDVQERVDELCRKFAHPPPECSPGKAARLAQVARQIERAAALFTNPLRRLHFDFNHGHVRVEERRAAGEDFTQLRSVWSEVFPERFAKAKEIARQAIMAEENGRIKDAAELARAALEHDPFNDGLRGAEMRWREGRATGAAREAGDDSAAGGEVDPSQALNELLSVQRKLPSMTNHELLGVPEGSSSQVVTNAYFERARRYDPDTLRGRVPPSVVAIAADYQRRLEAAYKTLSDPVRKARDQQAPQPVSAAPNAGPSAAPNAPDPGTKNEMGIVFLRKGDYAKARELFQSAVEADGKNPEFKANLAWSMIVDAAFSRADAMAIAKPLLEEAISTAPAKTALDHKRHARYHFYLGRLLRTEGQGPRAKKHFEAAVALDPSLTEATTELRLIEAQSRRK